MNSATKSMFEQTLGDKPGVIIVTEQVLVSKPNEPTPSWEIVRFVLDTNANEENLMVGGIYDFEYSKVNKSIMKFHRIDEFFALKNYLIQNGITRY